MQIRRVVIIVLDGLGVGEMPDAYMYGDAGSNTLSHVAKAVGGVNLPLLASFGLGCLTEVEGVECQAETAAAYGKMAESSKGKDTITGHWEMTGIIMQKPFPTFPAGFPDEIINPFTGAIGRPVLGNVAASGTEIIKELGEEHLRTGYPIVYTSADSVFQIAAHEEIVPLQQLYDWCTVARELLRGDYAVGRVIARPFRGEKGSFVRTPNRRDFSLPPPSETLLDKLKAAGHDVVAVGKIDDIFAGRGITRSIHTKNNEDGIKKILAALEERVSGLLFANLVDFDMLYGHRNDYYGYARALEQEDRQLEDVCAKIREDEILILVADHGCDPTFPNTDHTREYTPLLVYGPRVLRKPLGMRSTFADVGQTVAELLNVPPLENGTSFSRELGLKTK